MDLLSLLIILFAVLPGLPGENLYQRIVGSDWREDRWGKVLRVIGFSVGGIVLYLIVGSFVKAPLPDYIFPTTFDALPLTREQLVDMAIALAGHFVGAILAGVVSAVIVCAINRWGLVTGYPDSWDRFVRSYVARHWVVVRLEGGEVYAGVLQRADTSVQQEERDIILAEPAQYSEEKGNYVSLPYQYLFLPGALVDSIAVVHDPGQDKRLSTVGDLLFPKPANDSEEEAV